MDLLHELKHIMYSMSPSLYVVWSMEMSSAAVGRLRCKQCVFNNEDVALGDSWRQASF